MARRAEARTAVVAGADLGLAEAAIPCRPRHADIARNDLSKSLCSDPRRAEETAMAHLRTARQMRQAKGGNAKSGLGQIVDTISIREKPLPIDYKRCCTDRLRPPSKADVNLATQARPGCYEPTTWMKSSKPWPSCQATRLSCECAPPAVQPRACVRRQPGHWQRHVARTGKARSRSLEFF
jgi:hypothetical protein